VILDGEGVVCGQDGFFDFDRLRAAVGREGSRDAFLYALDLLDLDGSDKRTEAWEALGDSSAKAEHGIRMSEHIDGAEGDQVFLHACKLGLERIAAKRRDRPYRSGRSPLTAGWTNMLLRGLRYLGHPSRQKINKAKRPSNR
jgi:bifunctional non-homologous end joining protein LigD